MKNLKTLFAFVATVFCANLAQAQTMVINWNAEIFPLSETVNVTYDFGSDTYLRRVYVMDITSAPNIWVQRPELTDTLTGAGIEVILVPIEPYINEHEYFIQLRLKPLGGVTELASPRPETGGGIYSFSPLACPTLNVSDEPFINGSNYTFTVVARYGHPAPDVLLRLRRILTNTTTGSVWTEDRMITPGFSNTEYYDFELDEPGHYVLSYELWYKDAGLAPLWNWELVSNSSSCSTFAVVEFDHDFSTGIDDQAECKPCEMRVFPNPATEAETVTIENLIPGQSLQVIGSDGRLVHVLLTPSSSSTLMMSLAGYAPGAYQLVQTSEIGERRACGLVVTNY